MFHTVSQTRIVAETRDELPARAAIMARPDPPAFLSHVPMHLFFEDDGHKAGTILADNDSSLQVESVSGKRLKIKAASVLLRFTEPSPSALLADAHRLSAELDPNFLWEVSGEEEFGFDELAHEYFGHPPKPAEAAAVAMALQSAPMYFYKRGKGRYRKAPPDALRSALASVERKRHEKAQVEGWVAQLVARKLPDALAARLSMLLYKPDKNTLEWKALDAACDELHTNPLALLAECGAIPSSHDYHYNGFLAEAFPRGVAFPPIGELPATPDLPLAPVRAFSIDDATTTEIDDAFSVRELPNGHYEIGIHIAAPALAIPRGTVLDAIARGRLSTVYMPGCKITMLPDEAIAGFTLAAGTDAPALSLYIEADAEGRILHHSTRVNRVPIAANLRLNELDDAFTQDVPMPGHRRWSTELRVLWKVAQRLSDARGKPDIARIDYSFYIDWDAARDGRVSIVPRLRGSPIDKVVSELMILVNNTWGRLLADAGTVGLYRTQANGKVRMSTRPAEHQGLGLAHYLWASSPLRRYCDLINQRQLLAVIQGARPPYADNDAELFAALADFELTYAQYAEFQNRMEHYWCLRWLLQENVRHTTATVLRENLVRFDSLPLVMRLADAPSLPSETRVRVNIGAIDLIAATLQCRYGGSANDDASGATLQ